MNERVQLQERFCGLVERMDGEAGGAYRAFEYMWKRYEAPGRAYHTMTWHIQHALRELDAAEKVDGVDRDVVEFALWWHDVIYDGRAKDNEERSARWARVACSALFGLAGMKLKPMMTTLIMATTHEQQPGRGPLFHERCLMTDVDLAGLGHSPAEFDENGRRIRIEYAWASDRQYKTGRTKFAKKMLKRKSVFSRSDFRLKYEAQAQKNLRALAGGKAAWRA